MVTQRPMAKAMRTPAPSKAADHMRNRTTKQGNPNMKRVMPPRQYPRPACKLNHQHLRADGSQESDH
eukprot:6330230-Karenia_brevis.AAC.1